MQGQIGTLLIAAAALAFAQDGAALFAKHCASCHRAGSANRAPLPEALALLAPEAVVRSLEAGSMKEQGSALSLAEKQAVARFVAKGTGSGFPASALCGASVESRTDSSFWNGWGVDAANTRFQPANMAGFGEADVPRLKLRWAFGIPNANAAIAQPVVVGGRLYFGSLDGTVYSLDARTGCVYWTFRAEAAVRAAITVTAIQSGRYAVLFGDAKANVYAVDVPTAQLAWKTKVDEHPWARITGAPKLHETRLYVPVSSTEEVPAGNPKYECCTFRGSVAALHAESGRVMWKSHTIAEAPKPVRKNAEGTQLHAPNGGAVWSSPTIDAERRVLYVGTGNAYLDPAADTADAVLALDLDSGTVKWKRQLTAGDSWTFSCIGSGRANCAETAGPDFDIGASPILRGGKLIVGQKSGIVYALDPAAEGKIVWQTRVGKGSALGGVMWGMAADERAVYVPVSDVATAAPGGLVALRIDDGSKLWSVEPHRPACAGKRGCSAARMAPATAIPGVVFSGSMDGRLDAYAAGDGKLVWSVETMREFDAVNGVKAAGGSFNGSGPVVAERMLFVGSGYGILGGVAGNALLAFAVEER